MTSLNRSPPRKSLRGGEDGQLCRVTALTVLIDLTALTIPTLLIDPAVQNHSSPQASEMAFLA